jgi:hypothetical protein
MTRSPEFSPVSNPDPDQEGREGGVGLAVNIPTRGKERGRRRAVGMIAGQQTRDDMAQVYKIVKGVGGVNSEQWFKTAENARETRRTDPTNQCSRSMTFWGGSGSGSADPCL